MNLLEVEVSAVKQSTMGEREQEYRVSLTESLRVLRVKATAVMVDQGMVQLIGPCGEVRALFAAERVTSVIAAGTVI